MFKTYPHTHQREAAHENTFVVCPRDLASKLESVRRADRIVVLEGGTISDIGAHEDLMKKLGTYRRLYDLQFVDMEQPKVAAR